MGSYCHICGNFVNSLDDCELPYGGAPAPYYYYEEENLDVLENPYYVPPLLPENFEIFFRESPPAYTTRKNTQKFRTNRLNQLISPLLAEIRETTGVVNKLAIVDRIYAIIKDNMDILKNNATLYTVAKIKLDEFIRDFPEARYLKTIRIQLFPS